MAIVLTGLPFCLAETAGQVDKIDRVRPARDLETLGHGGDTWLFHSQLILIPEERTGLLVVYNTQTAASPARD